MPFDLPGPWIGVQNPWNKAKSMQEECIDYFLKMWKSKA